MTPKPEKYAPHSEADILALIRAHPFAWLVSAEGGFEATPLPLRPRLDADGKLIALVGHFARSNPQVERLRQTPRALLLFMGQHTYVSPSWMADRTQAPTWNYMSAAFDCALTLIDDAEGIKDLLDDLITEMEAANPAPWSMAEMGERAAKLSRGVVGFRADIISHNAAFKLGQDERDDVFADILTGLKDIPQADLIAHMQRYRG